MILKNLLLKNWVKVAVAILLVAGLIFMAYYFTGQQSLGLIRKCNIDGQKFFDQYKSKEAIAGRILGEPTYHFNRQLNTCLISINYQDSTHYNFNGSEYLPAHDIDFDSVTDIYSNQLLISTESLSSDTDYQQKKEGLMRADFG